MRSTLAMLFLLLLVTATSLHAGPIGWVPDHVVVVIEENHNLSQILGSSNAPYMNALAASGALFTQSYNPPGMHPSLPNYLELFSGSNQGTNSDGRLTLSSPYPPNLGAALIAAGDTFTGYSEGLPSVGFTGNASGEYVRKHNPWVVWQGADDNNLLPNQLPSTVNQSFTAFPSDFSLLPTVSFVVPNLCDDAHDTCNANGDVPTMDAWLQSNISPYALWANTHNSLLIVTTDESISGDNPIYTVFAGSNVIAGQYSETITHDNVLSTIESLYGIAPIGNSANAAPVSDAFESSAVPEPGTITLMLTALSGLSAMRWRKR